MAKLNWDKTRRIDKRQHLSLRDEQEQIEQDRAARWLQRHDGRAAITLSSKVGTPSRRRTTGARSRRARRPRPSLERPAP
jgi:hypothetical protein